MGLALEGALGQHPGLRVVLVGSGATWLPSLAWRLDKNWKGVRREVPWVDRPPSEAIRHGVWLTVPPVDAPPDAFPEALDGMAAMLLRAGGDGPLPGEVNFDANARQAYSRLGN